MSPIVDDDHRDIAIDMVPDSLHDQTTTPPPQEVGETDLHTVILHSLDAIRI